MNSLSLSKNDDDDDARWEKGSVSADRTIHHPSLAFPQFTAWRARSILIITSNASAAGVLEQTDYQGNLGIN